MPIMAVFIRQHCSVKKKKKISDQIKHWCREGAACGWVPGKEGQKGVEQWAVGQGDGRGLVDKGLHRDSDTGQ